MTTEEREAKILANRGLVYAEVLKFVKSPEIERFDDLLGEGTLGLIWAIDNWDDDKIGGQKKFSTYACRCISGFIYAALKKNSIIPVCATTWKRYQGLGYDDLDKERFAQIRKERQGITRNTLVAILRMKTRISLEYTKHLPQGERFVAWP